VRFDSYNLQFFDDDVNILSEKINTRNKNTETLLETCREVGLEVNIDNTKHMVESSHQNAGQNRNLSTAN
jgi:hypothetical protein